MKLNRIIPAFLMLLMVAFAANLTGCTNEVQESAETVTLRVKVQNGDDYVMIDREVLVTDLQFEAETIFDTVNSALKASSGSAAITFKTGDRVFDTKSVSYGSNIDLNPVFVALLHSNGGVSKLAEEYTCTTQAGCWFDGGTGAECGCITRCENGSIIYTPHACGYPKGGGSIEQGQQHNETGED